MSSSSDPRHKVLWVAKGLGTGGMEQLLVTHSRLRSSDEFAYEAAYVVERDNPVTSQLEALGVPCHRLGSSGANSLGWVAELRRLVSERGIDIVHTHSPLLAGIGRPVLRLLRPRPRLVYTEHNTWDSHVRPTRAVNAITYRLDDAQIAVSSAVYESVPRFLRGRLEVLTHGVDLEAVRARAEGADLRDQLGIPPDHLVCLTVANLRIQKAHDILLRAARTVVDTGAGVTFVCVGQGPLEDDLNRQRDALGLGRAFRFLGHRPDIPELLGTADAFVLASREEGLPLALMEAMGVGLPVVVTRVGGMPAYVVDGESGLVVEPDAADELASAISRLLEDAPLRSRLGHEAATVAGAFDAVRAVARIEAIYRETLA